MTPAQPCDSTVTVDAVLVGRTHHYEATCPDLYKSLVPGDHLQSQGTIADDEAYRSLLDQQRQAAARLFAEETIQLLPADVFTRSQRRQCLTCWPHWVGALRNRLGRRIRYRDHGRRLVLLGNLTLTSHHTGQRTLLGRMLDELEVTGHAAGTERLERNNYQLLCLPGPWAGWLDDLLDRWPNASAGDRRRWSAPAPAGYDHAVHGPTMAGLLAVPLAEQVPLAEVAERTFALTRAVLGRTD